MPACTCRRTDSHFLVAPARGRSPKFSHAAVQGCRWRGGRPDTVCGFQLLYCRAARRKVLARLRILPGRMPRRHQSAEVGFAPLAALPTKRPMARRRCTPVQTALAIFSQGTLSINTAERNTAGFLISSPTGLPSARPLQMRRQSTAAEEDDQHPWWREMRDGAACAASCSRARRVSRPTDEACDRCSTQTTRARVASAAFSSSALCFNTPMFARR